MSGTITTSEASAIVYISGEFVGVLQPNGQRANEYYSGSGVLITPDEVLTASHVVFTTDAGSASKLQVIPGYNSGSGAQPFGDYSEQSLHFNKVFNLNDLETPEEAQNDYAVIHLSQPVVGATTLPLLVEPLTAPIIGTDIGYPGGAGPTTAQGAYFPDPNYSVWDGPGTGPGSSGGPLVVDNGFGPQIVGVVSTGDPTTNESFYPIITPTVLAKIEGWVAQDDGLAAAAALTRPSALAISGDIDRLQALAASGQLSPFLLSDSAFGLGIGTLAITIGQLETDSQALSFIAAPFDVTLGATYARGTIPVLDGTALGFLTQVSVVQYADGRLVYDPNDRAAQVTRLYQAAFGRGADQPGLVFWTGLMQQGVSEASVANAFIGSAEFQARYGASITNAGFVNQLYQNVLGRGPDPSGAAYWNGQLASGESRASVLLGFSDSPENQGNTATTVHSGVWDLDGAIPGLYRLYDAAFGRMPDTSGLQYFAGLIDSGKETLAQVAQGFVNSTEFRSLYGPLLSTSQYVAELYRNTLHRAPSAADSTFWTNLIDSGAINRAEALVGFSESPEHQALTNANIFGTSTATLGIKIGSTA